MNTPTLAPALIDADDVVDLTSPLRDVADLTRALRYASAEAADGHSYRDSLNGGLWSLTWEVDSLTHPGRIAKAAIGLVEKVLADTGRTLDAVDGLSRQELAGVFRRAADRAGADR